MADKELVKILKKAILQFEREGKPTRFINIIGVLSQPQHKPVRDWLHKKYLVATDRQQFILDHPRDFLYNEDNGFITINKTPHFKKPNLLVELENDVSANDYNESYAARIDKDTTKVELLHMVVSRVIEGQKDERQVQGDYYDDEDAMNGATGRDQTERVANMPVTLDEVMKYVDQYRNLLNYFGQDPNEDKLADGLSAFSLEVPGMFIVDKIGKRITLDDGVANNVGDALTQLKTSLTLSFKKLLPVIIMTLSRTESASRWRQRESVLVEKLWRDHKYLMNQLVDKKQSGVVPFIEENLKNSFRIEKNQNGEKLIEVAESSTLSRDAQLAVRVRDRCGILLKNKTGNIVTVLKRSAIVKMYIEDNDHNTLKIRIDSEHCNVGGNQMRADWRDTLHKNDEINFDAKYFSVEGNTAGRSWYATDIINITHSDDCYRCIDKEQVNNQSVSADVLAKKKGDIMEAVPIDKISREGVPPGKRGKRKNRNKPVEFKHEQQQSQTETILTHS